MSGVGSERVVASSIVLVETQPSTRDLKHWRLMIAVQTSIQGMMPRNQIISLGLLMPSIASGDFKLIRREYGKRVQAHLPPTTISIELDHSVLFCRHGWRWDFVLSLELPSAHQSDPRFLAESFWLGLVAIHLQEVLLFLGQWLNLSRCECIQPVPKLFEGLDLYWWENGSRAAKCERSLAQEVQVICWNL
jgi:hypothetical protein